ncbi:MAG: hypothetical protein B7X55_02040 [Rhodobacterales bacterium 34-62-10]|nr:MAG: hypothetical protein B7X55_02040 [Rhodobacterales bacterium 34-62-10]
MEQTASTPHPAEPLRGKDLIRDAGFWNVVREDFRTHRKDIFLPGFQAVLVYRFGTWTDTIGFRPLALAMKAIHYFAYVFVRNVYGIELRRTIQAGRRFEIGHQSGIVVHEFARIGDDVVIRQNVTFGIGTSWAWGEGPTIGSRVSFSPGVVVIGNITIGDDVSIGPNCVITQDVPSGRTLFVPPPRAVPKADTVKQGAGDQPA